MEGMMKGAIITVEWGYEIHQLVLSPEDWASVKSGQELNITGEGYRYDGCFYWDYWTFGGGLDGSLLVEYEDTENYAWSRGVGFDGHLSDAMIEEMDCISQSRDRNSDV